MAARIALVGPGRSFRGGISEHTVALARRLEEQKRLTEHASWGRQFPRILHAGGTSLRERKISYRGRSRAVVMETRDLHWNRPDSWIRVARRLRLTAQRLVLVVSSPLQMPALVMIARVFRNGVAGKNVTAIVHNAVPHEATRLDTPLMRAILHEVDIVVVHSPEQEEFAEAMGAGSIRRAVLPFHPPEGLRIGRHAAGERRTDTLAFLGFVRHYKGLDVLLQALSQTTNSPRLLVRGEFWESIANYRAMVERLGLTDRVTLVPGYASAAELSDVLGSADALVLPYRSATGSQQPRLSFSCGVPAIVTDVGDLADQVIHGVDGLVTDPDDPAALARSIDDFYTEDRWLRLRRNVTQPNADEEWAAYLEVLCS